MRIIWPMGCKMIKDEDLLQKLINDPNYIGQEKIDGVRGVLQVGSDGRIAITTRGSTKANPDIPIDISHRFPGMTKWSVTKLAGTIIDGEIFDENLTSAELAGIVNYRSTVDIPDTLGFKAFDLLQYGNQHLDYYPWSVRDRNLKVILGFLPQLPIQYVDHVSSAEDKERLLHDLLAAGLEGMVFKNKDGLYQFGTPKRAAKPSHNWYKYKKKDTVDVTIIGSLEPDQFYTDPDTRALDLSRHTKPWARGWFGSIEFKFTDDDGEHIGSCSGITDYQREILGDGNHGIKEEYIGRIMEVEFMEKTSDGNLRHPRFVRIREEIEHENG